MSALSIQPTYPIFTETDGQPLENGYIWIGAANLDPQGNPINVYWDAALTQLAAQPIRTQSGYPVNSGTPARLYVNSDYSIRVMNKNGSVVYSAPSATERYSDVVVSVNAQDVIYDPPFANAVQTNVEAKLAQMVSVQDFGAVGDGVTNDTIAFQNAAAYCQSSGAGLYIPAVDTYYLISGTVDFSGIAVIDGKGGEIRSSVSGAPTAIIGNVRNAYIYLQVRSTTDRSIVNGTVGIKVLELNNSKCWLYARGFDEGLYFDGKTADAGFVGNEFNILHLHNNGSHVHFDLAGNSYFVSNQFRGGGYYLGTNQKKAGRGTFKVTLSGSSQINSVDVYDAEIGVDGGSANSDHAILLYATCGTTFNVNTFFFKNARVEQYSSFASKPYLINIPTTTSGRMTIDAQMSQVATDDRWQVSIGSGTHNIYLRDDSNFSVGGASFGQQSNLIPINPYQAGDKIYVQNRTLYDGDFSSPVQTIGANSTNRALGDGTVILSSATKAFGVRLKKTSASTQCFLKLSEIAQLVVICYDAAGNVLSGTSPYYAVMKSTTVSARTGAVVYESDGSNWVYIHPDVDSFYLGVSGWAGAAYMADVQFTVTVGPNLTVDNTYKTASGMITDSANVQSYLRSGETLEGIGERGYRNDFYLGTTAQSGSSSGATTIQLSNPAGVTDGDYIGIELDTVIFGSARVVQHTRVVSIIADVATLADALTANVAAGRKIFVNRWKIQENVAWYAPTTSFQSAANSINVVGKNQGVIAFDSTANKMVVASGANPTSTWIYVDGSGVITPV